MATQILKPVDYPHTANSGIFDAGLFSFGDSLRMHYPAHYPTANMVTALCGTYGYVVERDSRLISWASGWEDGQYTCPTCAHRNGD